MNILTWIQLNWAQKQRLMRELLTVPENAQSMYYRNTTGRVFLQDGELMGEWQSAHALLDAVNVKFIGFRSTAYCKQGYIFFYKEGKVIKTMTRQLLDVKDPVAVIESTIKKQTKLKYDEVVVVELPFKDLKWLP